MSRINEAIGDICEQMTLKDMLIEELKNKYPVQVNEEVLTLIIDGGK